MLHALRLDIADRGHSPKARHDTSVFAMEISMIILSK
jgi:hypothetical protein